MNLTEDELEDEIGGGDELEDETEMFGDEEDMDDEEEDFDADIDFSVSDNEDISLSDLIEKISKFMNLSPNLFSFPPAILKLLNHLFFRNNSLNNVMDEFSCNNEDVNKILGWSPVYSLDQEIQELVRWYQKN